MKIIKALVLHMGASLNIVERQPGTEFVIEIPYLVPDVPTQAVAGGFRQARPRLLDEMDLVGGIEPTHGDAEQEAQTRHRAIARLDRGAGLHQVPLE